MATLEEVLKKINKNKAEEDKIKANPKKGELTTDFSSTGSVYLDYILEQKAIPLGRMTLMTGWESSGKSSVALIAAREIQKKTDKTVVIMDGEHTVSDSHIDRFNLDRKKLIVYKESNLEQMLDTTEALSTADDIGGIVIDSVKAFYSSAVEAKSAEDILMKKDEGYLAWMTDPKTNFNFNWVRDGQKIKKAVYHQLKLPTENYAN